MKTSKVKTFPFNEKSCLTKNAFINVLYSITKIFKFLKRGGTHYLAELAAKQINFYELKA